MEARLSEVEKAVVGINKTLDFMRENMATKADVQAVKTDIEAATNGTQRWMIATVLGLFIGFGGMFFGMANFLKSGPAPAAAAAPAAAPTIVVNVPPQAAAPVAPAASR